MGRHHDIIDRQIDNRESTEIGKSMSPQRHKHENNLLNPELPKLFNDINKHKEMRQRSYGYNVLTGSYNKVSG